MQRERVFYMKTNFSIKRIWSGIPIISFDVKSDKNIFRLSAFIPREGNFSGVSNEFIFELLSLPVVIEVMVSSNEGYFELEEPDMIYCLAISTFDFNVFLVDMASRLKEKPRRANNSNEMIRLGSIDLQYYKKNERKDEDVFIRINSPEYDGMDGFQFVYDDFRNGFLDFKDDCERLMR